MDAASRIVTRLPLEHLWRSETTVGSRRSALTSDDLRKLLRQGIVEFVVADVGQALQWIKPEDCYGFWKTEISPHLATAAGITPEQFSGAYCYLASDWGSGETGLPIVVLERYH